MKNPPLSDGGHAPMSTTTRNEATRAHILNERHWNEPDESIRHDDTDNVEDGRCLACERLQVILDEEVTG